MSSALSKSSSHSNPYIPPSIQGNTSPVYAYSSLPNSSAAGNIPSEIPSPLMSSHDSSSQSPIALLSDPSSPHSPSLNQSFGANGAVEAAKTDTSGEEGGHWYSPFTAYCYSVNYILGVGVLGMPYAFQQAGYVLSILLLFIVTLMAIATALWITDINARAQILTEIREREALLMSADGVVAASKDNSEAKEEKENGIGNGVNENGNGQAKDKDSSNNHSREESSIQLLMERKRKVSYESIVHTAYFRKFEMNQLVEFFMGERARIIYDIFIIIYLMGSLWSYTSVFASSFASHVPLPFLNNGSECDVSEDGSQDCSNLYLMYLLFFALLAVPLTCISLTEMFVLQIVLAAFRFIALFSMMSTSIAAIYSYPNTDLQNDPTVHNYPSSAPYYSNISPFLIGGIATIFPTSIFAQIFHHSIPILAQPVRPSQRHTVPHIFVAVLITTFLLYGALGLTVGLYYGSSVKETCTINWAGYDGGYPDGKPGWAVFMSYMIVLFPPLDILSAFPLNAITLGNNLLCMFVKDREKQKQRKYVIPFRLLAALPPIAGACIVKDLAPVLRYTGCVGVFIAFLYPTILQYTSMQVWKKELSASPEEEENNERSTKRRLLTSEWMGLRVFTLSHPLFQRKELMIAVFVFSVIGVVAVFILSFVS